MRELTPRRSDVPAPRGHLSYYGLRASPFRAIAEPDLLWLGTTHRTVLATLTTAIRRGGGVLLLTGDIGAGKTSLANALLAGLSCEPLLIGRIPSPGFESSEFFNAVTAAFGIGGTFDAKVSFVASVQELLSSAASDRKRVLLVVDEAHRLTPELLEEIQDLSAIGTASGLTILLVGQEELRATLSEHRLAALRRRIAANCAVDLLTTNEVGQYIRHRLALAGVEDEIFSLEAIRVIASISRGAPGIINITCDGALLTGYQRQARTIREEIIEDGFTQAALPSEPAVRQSRRAERARDIALHRASGRRAYARGGQTGAGDEPISLYIEVAGGRTDPTRANPPLGPAR